MNIGFTLLTPIQPVLVAYLEMYEGAPVRLFSRISLLNT